MFRDQPIDQKLGCGMTEVQFLCDYVVGGQTNRPFPTWIINSRPFSSNELPHNHTFNGSVLSIHNVSLAQNNTSYQCVVGVFSGQGQRILYYNSTVGHLIIKCRGETTCYYVVIQNVWLHDAGIIIVYCCLVLSDGGKLTIML